MVKLTDAQRRHLIMCAIRSNNDDSGEGYIAQDKRSENVLERLLSLGYVTSPSTSGLVGYKVTELGRQAMIDNCCFTRPTRTIELKTPPTSISSSTNSVDPDSCRHGFIGPSAPTSILWSLGYDDMLNNPDLLHPKDKAELDAGIRRAGDVLCKCGWSYHSHPKVQGALWATRTCEGIVKL